MHNSVESVDLFVFMFRLLVHFDNAIKLAKRGLKKVLPTT